MSDVAIALAYFGAVLVVFCLCGMLAERFLYTKDEERRPPGGQEGHQ